MKLEVFLSLDLISLDKALRIARLAVKAGFKEIEAGTPLIKSEGITSVKYLRREFPESKIFADMKTMDTGALEAELAFEAGADIMSVMAVAPNETIKEAVRKADEMKKEVLIDTLGLRDVTSRIRELVDMGIHRVCLHRGIDEGIFSEYDLLDSLKEMSVKIGVAGGINASTISDVARRADFVMVGRAITKSDNPERAAESILRAVNLL